MTTLVCLFLWRRSTNEQNFSFRSWIACVNLSAIKRALRGFLFQDTQFDCFAYEYGSQQQKNSSETTWMIHNQWISTTTTTTTKNLIRLWTLHKKNLLHQVIFITLSNYLPCIIYLWQSWMSNNHFRLH